MRRRETGRAHRFETFSCYQRLQLMGTARVRAAVLASIVEARKKHGFDLIAYVIMPEHLHLMVCPATGTKWGPIAGAMKSSLARLVLNRWKRLNAPVLNRLRMPSGRYRFWQHGGGFDRNVRHDGEFEKEIRYIHRNPVTRRLVESPLEWDATSARYWLARYEGREHECEDVPCDWPMGNEMAWRHWSGFM